MSWQGQSGNEDESLGPQDDSVVIARKRSFCCRALWISQGQLRVTPEARASRTVLLEQIMHPSFHLPCQHL